MEERTEADWERLPEWPALYELIEGVVSQNRAKHPGTITEVIVDTVSDRFAMIPRETHHRERRRNHQERVRRLSHSVFRVLDAGSGEAPTARITATVLKAFILTPRPRSSVEQP